MEKIHEGLDYQQLLSISRITGVKADFKFDNKSTNHFPNNQQVQMALFFSRRERAYFLYTERTREKYPETFSANLPIYRILS